MTTLCIRFNEYNEVQLLEKELNSYQIITEYDSKKNYQNIIVFIPAILVSNYNVELAVKNNRQLKQIIPNLLEIELAENINNLIFAYKKAKDKNINVFVIAKNVVSKYLELLSDIDITPDYIFSELDAVLSPDNDNYNITNTNKYSIIKSSSEVFAINNQLAEDIINNISNTINYYGESNYLNKSNYKQVDMLEFLASSVDVKTNINILDFHNTDHKIAINTFKPYIFSIILVITLLTSAYSYLFIKQSEQQQKLDNINQQEINLYKKTFPNAINIRDPYARMLGKLKIQNTKQNNNFIKLLKILNTVNIDNISINNINYNNKKLILKSSSNNVLSLERFERNLSNKFNIKINQTSSDKNTTIIIFELKLKK